MIRVFGSRKFPTPTAEITMNGTSKTGPGRYDYANTRAGYGTREMAEKNRVDAAADLLFGSIYQYANFHMAHTYVEENGDGIHGGPKAERV